jgi:hypothetical protein
MYPSNRTKLHPSLYPQIKDEAIDFISLIHLPYLGKKLSILSGWIIKCIHPFELTTSQFIIPIMAMAH